MKIETYEIESVQSDIENAANDFNVSEVIEKLGLTGQKKLLNPDTLERVQFRAMTLLEQAVYGELFPEKDLLDKFETELIPSKVFQVIEKAVATGKFVRFTVWHSRTRKDDPLLVGATGDLKQESWGEYILGEKLYLIARWGDSLAEFPKLLAEAKKAWLSTNRFKLKKEIADAKQKLELLDDEAEQRFTTGQSL